MSALLQNTTKVAVSADRSALTEVKTETVSFHRQGKETNNTFQFDIYEAHEARYYPNMFVQNAPLEAPRHQLGYKFVVDRSQPTINPAQANRLVMPTEEFTNKVAQSQQPPKMFG